MSGRSRIRPPENWQIGHDYWLYFPTISSDFVPAHRTLDPRARTRAPWWFFEERSTGGSNHGLASFASAAPPGSSAGLLLIEDYNTYARARGTMPENHPTYYESPYNLASPEEESMLSPEEQKQALNKLRKQLYSPHLSNIIMRLGAKSTSNGDASASLHHDDGKRCAVCLEDFESRQFVTLTPCNHMYHEECIVPWVKTHGKCPVCRFVIVEQSKIQAPPPLPPPPPPRRLMGLRGM